MCVVRCMLSERRGESIGKQRRLTVENELISKSEAGIEEWIGCALTVVRHLERIIERLRDIREVWTEGELGNYM